MGRKWQPPFRVEADFYDAKGELLEWIEEWGECQDATKVLYRVVDTSDQAHSTHNSKAAAESALERINKLIADL